MMGSWQQVTNLRSYISQNPPGVTFFLCLLALAISFICLSTYSYTHTLPNPDITKDWNHLLSSLAQLQLCEKSNASSSELESQVPPPPNGDASVESMEAYAFTSLCLKVHLDVSATSDADSLKDFALHATLRAEHLNLGGNEMINVTLEFSPDNDSYTCLTIKAPTHLLPMSLLPPECPAFERNISPIDVEASNQPPTASQTCYSLHAKSDPMLTVMLQQWEQNVAVRHLLEVSMCLLVVCLGLCVAASLQPLTRRHHSNGLDLQNKLLGYT